jgi:hypothetical protein
MKLQFTKMHGLGNDFVVIDGISQTVALSTGADSPWRIVVLALVAIKCWWWRRLKRRRSIFATAFSTRMAVRSSSAAMALAASPALSATGV